MPYLGEVCAFAFELPGGWLPCDGQLLEIRRAPALFSLLGTTYGGDGVATFAVPDLRGRVVAGVNPGGNKRLGDASAASGPENAAIPYHVVHWGICVTGAYPVRGGSAVARQARGTG